jgi:hypothetical protein
MNRVVEVKVLASAFVRLSMKNCVNQLSSAAPSDVVLRIGGILEAQKRGTDDRTHRQGGVGACLRERVCGMSGAQLRKGMVGVDRQVDQLEFLIGKQQKPNRDGFVV